MESPGWWGLQGGGDTWANGWLAGRRCDQADVEAAVATDRGQLYEGFPEARRGAGPGHHSAKCRGTHRREANHDRSTVRRSLQGPDPADTDAGGVREPSRLVGVRAGNRREPDPPGAGRARRSRSGRQPALRGSRSHRNPDGRAQGGAGRQAASCPPGTFTSCARRYRASR